MRVTFSWSGGKDSAFALHKILLSKKYEVVNLHTVFGEETKRVGLHGIREELIEQQAESMGIPLVKLYLKASDNYSAYENLMCSFYQTCAARKIDGVVFGDIFLEDLKKYREELLKDSGLIPLYPIWKQNTMRLANEFIEEGFKTLICAANARYFSEHHLGCTLDHAFIKNLPVPVDPCGENGEFHTFVFDGPFFREPIRFFKGGITSKKYVYQRKNEDASTEQLESTFWFQELLPVIAS
jgi:uncharacterized protein (TIGR00290 family)